MARFKVQQRLFLPEYRGNLADWASSLIRALQLQWLDLVHTVNNGVVPTYYQTTEPDIAYNSIAIWVDPANEKYYLILNYNGIQKKLEFL